MNKKFLYIALFVVLGILLSFLLHIVVEISIIALLVSDFEMWNLGLSWDGWFSVHTIGTPLLILLGAYLGLKQGKHWWHIIYIEKRYGKIK